MSVSIFALLFWCSWHYFAGFIVIVAFIGQDEYQRMAHPEATLSHRLSMGFYTAILALSPLIAQLDIKTSLHVPLMISAWAVCFLLVAAKHLRQPLPLPKSAQRVGLDSLGILYLGATLPGILGLRLLDLEQGWAWVVLSMLITFGGDTGGYFAGRSLGGKLFGEKRLAPQLSPKKTWEGYIGGVILGTSGAFLAQSQLALCSSLTAIDCIILGFLGVSLGVAGDLFESLMKRSAGVKDSGTLIPGHGGVLDRIDALLFVAPTLYLYLMVRFAS